MTAPAVPASAPVAVAGSRPLVVLCAAVPWRGTTMLDHHLGRELTGYADVLYVDPPTSMLTRLRNPAAASAAEGPSTEVVAPGLAVLRPRVNPLMERRVGKPLALALTRRAMRRAVRRLGRPVHATILPTLNPLFGAVRERFSVLYASDDLVAGAGLMGIDEASLARTARRLAGQADVVVGVSPALVEGLRAQGADARLLPNGVDAVHFARTLTATPVPVPVPDGAPVAGFVGILGDRVDLTLLEAVADRGIHLLLVGPRQRNSDSPRWDALLARAEVHHLGPRRYEDLPEVLAAADVWLLPYGDSEFNRASFPLKLLEYLGGGRRVVATGLPAVHWLETSLITVAEDAESFAGAVAAEVSRPSRPGEREERLTFAAGHTWSSRVRTLAGHLSLVPLEPTPEGQR